MIIDCISDLHGHYPDLEGGDLLIIAGDLTAKDSEDEYSDFDRWTCRQDYERIVVIAGNHDNGLHKPERWVSWTTAQYLCDSGADFRGLKIWGSPWTRIFTGMDSRCQAFTVSTEEALAQKWRAIPCDTDILITHCPPFGMFDEVEDLALGKIENTGSHSLTHWSGKHGATLKLHVFGHVHEGYGVWDTREKQRSVSQCRYPVMVNASHVNKYYSPDNKPIRIHL